VRVKVVLDEMTGPVKLVAEVETGQLPVVPPVASKVQAVALVDVHCKYGLLPGGIVMGPLL
jgi:hypothetical protein